MHEAVLERHAMLWASAVILIGQWLRGVVISHITGGLIRVLLAIAKVVVLIRIIVGQTLRSRLQRIALEIPIPDTAMEMAVCNNNIYGIFIRIHSKLSYLDFHISDGDGPWKNSSSISGAKGMASGLALNLLTCRCRRDGFK